MQMKYLSTSRFYLSFLLALLASEAVAAELPTVPLFKAICAREKATGFNWKAGAWTQSNFVPDRKLLVQKIDFAANLNKPPMERLLLCSPPESTDLLFSTVTQACYVIRQFGKQQLPSDGEMCVESFEGKKLKSITCRRLTFLPDGPFIELPWHMEVDPAPKDDYKDSLVLSVGTCATLSE